MQPEIAPLKIQSNWDGKITLYLKISCSGWNFSQDIKKLIGTYNFTKSFCCVAIWIHNDLVLVRQKLKSCNNISPLAYFPLKIFRATWNCPSRKQANCIAKNNKYKITCRNYILHWLLKKLNLNQLFHKKLVLHGYFSC